ncbi:MAG: hypothetical protein KIT24_11435 [Phycisphaeraceae bacterium]|nr:hypothetical protein [Phycisphaeraceae bacterium]
MSIVIDHGDESVRREFDRNHAAVGSNDGRVPARAERDCVRALGAVYTPLHLVEHVLDGVFRCIDAHRLALGQVRICDPSCGDGRFLAAAAHRLTGDGASRGSGTAADIEHIIEHCVYGVDIDSDAVEACRSSLSAMAGGSARVRRALERHIRHGDALRGCPVGLFGHDAAVGERDMWCERAAPGVQPGALFHWDQAFAEVFDGDHAGFDAVVGNPPFLNQLERASAINRHDAALLCSRFHGCVKGYADTASAFMMLAHELCRIGGAIGMVMPQSFLAARDAAAVRRFLAERTILRSLWLADDYVFNASVYACAVIMQLTTERAGRCRLVLGTGLMKEDNADVDMRALSTAPTWAPLSASLRGVPRLEMAHNGILGDAAEISADFRDEYYALQHAIREACDVRPEDRHAWPRIVTTGLIDPARCAWGERPARLFRRSWQMPLLDVTMIECSEQVRSRLQQRLRPKLVLATQTLVMEVAADTCGLWMPVTPLISIVPHDESMLWMLGAAISSPMATVWAMQNYAGSALHANAIKLSAAQVRCLPMPADLEAWRGAAVSYRAAGEALSSSQAVVHFEDMGQGMLDAYLVPIHLRDEVIGWWLERVRRSYPPTNRE